MDKEKADASIRVKPSTRKKLNIIGAQREIKTHDGVILFLIKCLAAKQ